MHRIKYSPISLPTRGRIDRMFLFIYNNGEYLQVKRAISKGLATIEDGFLIVNNQYIKIFVSISGSSWLENAHLFFKLMPQDYLEDVKVGNLRSRKICAQFKGRLITLNESDGLVSAGSIEEKSMGKMFVFPKTELDKIMKVTNLHDKMIGFTDRNLEL